MTDQILQRSPKEQLNDFLHGQADCKAGKPHEAGRGADYDRGYACQYEVEALATANDELAEGMKRIEESRKQLKMRSKNHAR